MIENDVWTMGLAEVDRALAALVAAEERRQRDKVILIPSESLTPPAVREAMASAFTSIYAEGYPREEMLRLPEDRLAEVDEQLAYFRRYSDRRFYKGVEFADLVEALACRRAAECFATPEVGAEDIFVNVQALSGAAANMAIYDALLEPGDTLMAMDLSQGGHLSHGSPFHQSGRRYQMVRYGVDPRTERLDYDRIADLARQHRPRMILAGYTSYPWAPDWKAFREIASSCGAFLMADIAHTAGMAIAGAYPSPVGYADVVMFTTHKTLCGPRGAVILSFDPEIAARIDAAVFPGAQGGPHVNKWAGIAVALALARTPAFRDLQHRTVANAQALAAALAARGVRLAYGGTNTHLLVLDLRPLSTPNGGELMGEVAARILDLVGLVANKNTIPGDSSAADARGIRYGTPWVTQRGMGEREMEEIADVTRLVLTSIHPFAYQGLSGPLFRGKLPLSVLGEATERTRQLAARFGGQLDRPSAPTDRAGALRVRGGRAASFLHEACSTHVLGLDPGQGRRTLFLDGEGKVLSEAIVGRLPDDRWGRPEFAVLTPPGNAPRLHRWLAALADGYVLFDPDDVYRKVQGPAVVEPCTGPASFRLDDGTEIALGGGARAVPFLDVPVGADPRDRHPGLVAPRKPYFVGCQGIELPATRSAYTPAPPPSPLARTPLGGWHKGAGARMAEFAGFEMPLWYTSALAEHRAVRERAGLFDLGHMGVFAVEGRFAESFLNLVTTNYAGWLHPGQSQYAFLLTPNGEVVDDLIVYRQSRERFLLVVNAANASKDWDWLTAISAGKALLDPDRPWIEPDGPVTLRDLRGEGPDALVDIALQGPRSRAVLLRLLSGPDRHDLIALRRTEFCELSAGGIPILCARTGYTGEPLGYEILVPPNEARRLWESLIEVGREDGLPPVGLAARDSLRTEAGLPLYGHELAGPHRILPHEAGFAPYVKLHKPFFIGRSAVMRALGDWKREVVRFEIGPGQRPVRAGAPVVDQRGQVLGWVTSCVALDSGQVGMALLAARGLPAETPLGFIVGGERELPRALEPGARVPLFVWGRVLPRFLKREALPQAGED
ncbi:serine hydroxymethyltransferase [Candidatus Bipolaricaulota bacterium]|nr:serine hydroxymethyltransferase [Candidatus Bipolaricaulota bacterium]